MANALFILVDDVRFEPGINGLTASRLVEAYHVPAIAMGPSDDPDVYKGSARSIEGFNIFEALNDCRHLLEGFGGHPMAAGLSCRKDKITDLRRMLGILANKGGVKKTPDRNVDFVFDTDGLDLQSCDQFVCDIRRLAPFGPEFEKPVVGFEGKIYSRYVMKEKHLKYLVKNDAPGSIYSTPVIWWNAAEREGTVLPDALNKKICAIGYPAINEFNGDRSVQFIANEIDFAE
jgi:single-stranded-DNA-specific exonuclease